MKVYDKRLASPYLAWMVLFTVIPLLIVCYYALTDSDGHFTLANLVSVSGYGSVFARSLLLRSEERRVGKECRSRWSPYH